MGDAEDLELEFVAQADDADAASGSSSAKAAAAVEEEEPSVTENFSPEITEEDAAEGESVGQPYSPMGIRFVVRSVEGTKVVNTIEVLTPFELSV
jgi:hypothetical protein